MPRTLSRLLLAVYALAAYALFLGAFGYAILFVDDLWVPKTVDSGSGGPAWLAIAVDAAVLGLFGVQHSVMARPWFKRRWTRIVPVAAERSTFVVAASLALVLSFWLWRPLPGTVWLVAAEPWRSVLLGASLAGFGFTVASTFMIDHFDLFGLRQGLSGALGRTSAPPRFMTRGAYALVRHPIMTGLLIGFWAAPRMTVSRLCFAGLATGYILVGVWFEERDLRRELGETYTRYREQAGMFLPLPKRPTRAASTRSASAR